LITECADRSSKDKDQVGIENMAASITGFPIAVTEPATRALGVRSNRRRRVDPRAGHALEILGHAIEYLADEYVHEGATLSANDPQLQAVHLLMELNRQIYFECPEVPTLGERLCSLLRVSGLGN
jgi:hypothetical protein